MLKMQFSGTLQVVFFMECGAYVAHCPALDLSSQGKTIKEAEKNFFEALSIYLQETIAHGTLFDDLKEHGWKVNAKTFSLTPPSKAHHRIPLHILKDMHVPVYLPA